MPTPRLAPLLALVAALAPAGGQSVTAPRPRVDGPPDPVLLEPADDTERVGLVLGLAAAGDLAALRDVAGEVDVSASELAGVPELGALAGVLDRERREFLQACIAAGTQVELPIGAGEVSTVLTGLADDVLTFRAEDGGPDGELALADLSLVALERGLGTRREDFHAPGAEGLLRYLAGAKRWKRGFDRDDPRQAELAKTCARLEPELLLGRALVALRRLQDASTGLELDEHRARLERLEALAETFTAEPRLASRLPWLVELARVELCELGSGLEPAELVTGSWKALPRDRVVLTYDLTEPESFEDFTVSERALGWIFERESFPVRELDVLEGGADGWTLGGAVGLAHALPLGPPYAFTLRFRPRFERPDATFGFLCAGFYDAARKQALCSLGRDVLQVVDPVNGRHRQERATTAMGYTGDVLYEVRVALDGEHATLTSHDGGEIVLPAPELRSVTFALGVHTDQTIELTRLVLEGALAPGWRTALVRAWAARTARERFGDL